MNDTYIPEEYAQFGAEAGEILWQQHKIITRLERELRGIRTVRKNCETCVRDRTAGGHCTNCALYDYKKPCMWIPGKAARGE